MQMTLCTAARVALMDLLDAVLPPPVSLGQHNPDDMWYSEVQWSEDSQGSASCLGWVQHQPEPERLV